MNKELAIISMNTTYDNIAEGDHQKFLRDLIKVEGEMAAVQFIKGNMEKILEHYIVCTWGACYNTNSKNLFSHTLMIQSC